MFFSCGKILFSLFSHFHRFVYIFCICISSEAKQNNQMLDDDRLCVIFGCRSRISHSGESCKDVSFLIGEREGSCQVQYERNQLPYDYNQFSPTNYNTSCYSLDFEKVKQPGLYVCHSSNCAKKLLYTLHFCIFWQTIKKT